MRRSFAAVLAVLMSAVCFAADQGLIDDISGSYVIYRDARFGSEAFIGLAFLSEDSLAVRSFEPETGNEVMLLLSLAEGEKGIDVDPAVDVLRGSLDSSDAARRLVPMILDWAADWYANRYNIATEKTYASQSDIGYHYEFWIPVFQLRAIGSDGTFRLMTAGILKDVADPRFFRFSGIPESIEADTYTLIRDELMPVTVDGIQVPLDGNWLSVNNALYRIAKETPQDAVFFIETFDYNQLGTASVDQLVSLLALGNQNVVMIAENTEVTYEDGRFTLVFRLRDPSTRKITIQHTLVIPREGSVISSVSLACFESLYLANKAYFDAIMY